MNGKPWVPPWREDTTRIHLLEFENGVLMRRLGGIQQRISELLRIAAVRKDALECENLRLRAELVTVRTALFWGLPAIVSPRGPARTRRLVSPLAPDMTHARRVICQTGCVGHAHPWLDDSGHCRQSGQPCERIEP
jgi:hypothetical protein